MKSLDTLAMLLCRSSKLGEGRNSNEPVVLFSSAVGLLPKEKREWLLRVGALRVDELPEATRWRAAGL